MKVKHRVKPGVLWRITVRSGRHQGTYPTVVEWVSETDHTAGVGMPIRRGRFVGIPRGTVVHVVQDGDPAYSFDTVVEGHRYDGAPLLVVRVPERVERMQRRSYVRVPVQGNARVCLVGPDGVMGPRIDVRLKDISAGGLAFISKEPLEVGSVVHVTVPSFEVCSFADVVRVSDLRSAASPDHYVVGVRFRGMPEREVSRITRRIFHEQLVLRRKGLV